MQTNLEINTASTVFEAVHITRVTGILNCNSNPSHASIVNTPVPEPPPPPLLNLMNCIRHNCFLQTGQLAMLFPWPSITQVTMQKKQMRWPHCRMVTCPSRSAKGIRQMAFWAT